MNDCYTDIKEIRAHKEELENLRMYKLSLEVNIMVLIEDFLKHPDDPQYLDRAAAQIKTCQDQLISHNLFRSHF